jgi:hypothetical protein
LKKAGIIFALVALTILTGCSKFSVECELVLQPRVMLSAGSDPLTPADMARAYVFYIDEKDYLTPAWRPQSYSDAEAGIIRHNSTGEILPFNLTGAQEADNYIHITLTKSPMVLVAVDPVNKIYAWRTFQYEISLERLYVPVLFRIYQKEQFREGDWTFVSEESENVTQEEQEDSER